MSAIAHDLSTEDTRQLVAHAMAAANALESSPLAAASSIKTLIAELRWSGHPVRPEEGFRFLEELAAAVSDLSYREHWLEQFEANEDRLWAAWDDEEAVAVHLLDLIRRRGRGAAEVAK